MRDLGRFPDEDTALRAQLRSTPVAVEQRFGPGEVAPTGGTPAPSEPSCPAPDTSVAVPAGHGVAVHFRGTVDRIDRTTDGGAVVIDYKTGSAYGLRQIEEDAARGRRLQLPIYALAASAPAGVPSSRPVRALYWYVSERGGFERAELLFDEEARTRLSAVVTDMVEGIAGGVFPANPGPRENGEGGAPTYRNCRFCDFDSLCPRERASEWSRKHDDEAMSPYTRWAGQ
jgi:hypothetical protein